MNRSSTIDKEVNEAARAGYRVMGAWYPKGVQLILLKKTDGTGDAVEYKVLDPWDDSDLEKQLKAAAAVGYRLVPRTITISTTEFKNGRGRIRVLTAKAAGVSERYEYSVGVASGEMKLLGRARPMKGRLAANFEPGGPLQKDAIEREMQRLAAAGYSLVELLPRMDGKEKSPGLLSGFKEAPSKDLELYLVGERLAGSTAPLPPADRYRLVAGTPELQLQADLHEATAAGYRLALTSANIDPEMVLVFEKGGAAAVPECVVVGASSTLTLQFQLAEASALGFRASLPVVSSDAAVLMERAPGARNGYEYLMLERDFEKELAGTVAKGWAPIGMSRDGSLMLFEKNTGKAIESPPSSPKGAPPSSLFPPAGNRRTLGTARTATMEKELNEAAAQGYRFVRTAVVGFGQVATVEKVKEPPAGFEYRAIAERQDARLEGILNEAAAQGFRVVRGSAKTRPGTVGNDTLIMMEKTLSGTPSALKYRVIGATRLSTFTKELEEAKKEGGEVVGLLGSGDDHVAGPRVAILERSAK